MRNGSRVDGRFRGANNFTRGKGISVKKLSNGLDIGDLSFAKQENVINMHYMRGNTYAL